MSSHSFCCTTPLRKYQFRKRPTKSTKNGAKSRSGGKVAWQCPAPAGGGDSAEHTMVGTSGLSGPRTTSCVSALTPFPARVIACDPTFSGEYIPSRSKRSTLGPILDPRSTSRASLKPESPAGWETAPHHFCNNPKKLICIKATLSLSPRPPCQPQRPVTSHSSSCLRPSCRAHLPRCHRWVWDSGQGRPSEALETGCWNPLEGVGTLVATYRLQTKAPKTRLFLPTCRQGLLSCGPPHFPCLSPLSSSPSILPLIFPSTYLSILSTILLHPLATFLCSSHFSWLLIDHNILEKVWDRTNVIGRLYKDLKALSPVL